MKKIAYLLHDWNGALGYFDNTIAKLLSAEQYRVFLVAPEMSNLESKDSNILYIKTEKIFKITNNLYFTKNLYDILSKIQPDMIFTLDGMLDTLVVNNYVKSKKIPWFVKCHCDYSNTAISYWSYIFHLIVIRVIYVISDNSIYKYLYITPMTKKFMIQMYGLSRKKLRFFPIISNIRESLNDFSDNRKISNSKSKNNILNIFTGGKINSLKKTELLVEAAKELIGFVELIIVGRIDDTDEKYASNIFSLINKADNIKIIPWADQETLAKLISSCDVGVFPAGQSSLWQDCLSLNVPIIVGSGTDVSEQDPRYLVRNGSGVVIDKNLISKDILINELKRLYHDRKLLKIMQDGCQKNNLNLFSKNNLLKRIL